MKKILAAVVAVLMCSLAIPQAAATPELRAAPQTAAVHLPPTVHTTTTVGDVSGTERTYIDGKMTTQWATPYNKFRFNYKTVCQANETTSQVYPIWSAGNYMEAGSDLWLQYEGTAEAAANCAGYPDDQIIHYQLYSAANNNCWRTTGAWTYAGDGTNRWFHAQAQFNWTGPQKCKTYAANSASRLTGGVVGLTSYYDAASPPEPCVMNTYWQSAYPWARPCDQDRLYWLYNF